MDVTNTHSERKINDLQEHLDTQHDIIYETEELLVSVKIRNLEA